MLRAASPAPRFWGIPRGAPKDRPETFAEFVERYRSTVHLLCYRMTGSFDDAIRLTHEAFLTGWRLRASAPADTDGWLAAIAVRACVEFSRRHRPDPRSAPDASDCVPRTDVTWLQPYPDRLLPVNIDPDTIGLPFVVATQSLPPRDRAALLLADVEHWPQARVAGVLRLPNADATQRVHRAQETIRALWSPDSEPVAPDDDRIGELRTAFEQADRDRIVDVLHEDVAVTMPPLPFRFEGRDTVAALLGQVFQAADGTGGRRCTPTAANRQSAFAVYVQPTTDAPFRGHEIVVVRTAGDRVVELTLFEPHLIPAFGLPADL